jgi:L-alanine-DL-glutamate epimerase-like enolase superfamily enzyme
LTRDHPRTPGDSIAFADTPLLNADGVHEPHVLRAVIELVVDDGRGGEVTGLGECTGHSWQLDWLTLVGEFIVGRSVFDSTGLRDLVDATLTERSTASRLAAMTHAAAAEFTSRREHPAGTDVYVHC